MIKYVWWPETDLVRCIRYNDFRGPLTENEAEVDAVIGDAAGMDLPMTLDTKIRCRGLAKEILNELRKQC